MVYTWSLNLLELASWHSHTTANKWDVIDILKDFIWYEKTNEDMALRSTIKVLYLSAVLELPQACHHSLNLPHAMEDEEEPGNHLESDQVFAHMSMIPTIIWNILLSPERKPWIPNMSKTCLDIDRFWQNKENGAHIHTHTHQPTSIEFEKHIHNISSNFLGALSNHIEVVKRVEMKTCSTHFKHFLAQTLRRTMRHWLCRTVPHYALLCHLANNPSPVVWFLGPPSQKRTFCATTSKNHFGKCWAIFSKIGSVGDTSDCWWT